MIEDRFKTYEFTGELWRHDGPGGWFFVSMPQSLSQEVRVNHQSSEEGWGRLKAEVTLKNLTWKSAIWYDTKYQGYLVPIKGEIRRKGKVGEGDILTLCVSLEF